MFIIIKNLLSNLQNLTEFSKKTAKLLVDIFTFYTSQISKNSDISLSHLLNFLAEFWQSFFCAS